MTEETKATWGLPEGERLQRYVDKPPRGTAFPQTLILAFGMAANDLNSLEATVKALREALQDAMRGIDESAWLDSVRAALALTGSGSSEVKGE